MKISENVIRYIQQQELFSIPQLQDKFFLSYYEAHRIVDELLEERSIAFNGGIEYKVINNRRGHYRFHESDKSEKKSKEEKQEVIDEYRAELEKRRQELIKRMQATFEGDDDDDDEENEEDDDDDEDDDHENNEEDERTDGESQEENGEDENIWLSDEDCFGMLMTEKDFPFEFITASNETSFLYGLIKSDKDMTRKDAINKVEAFIEEAHSRHFFHRAIFLRNVMKRLVALTDRKYKKLSQELFDDGK